MTTIELTRASGYWRDRFLGIAQTLHTELHEDAAYFAYEGRAAALYRLSSIGMASKAKRVEYYRTGYHTVFLPGVPALLVDKPGHWAALCTTTSDGRLATIDAVATWIREATV